MPAKNTDNKIRKTLLTPCRRVGLKRKSVQNISQDCTPVTPVTNTDSSSSSVELNNSATPIRHPVDGIVKSIALNLESNNNVTPVRHETDISTSRLEKKLKLDHIKAKKILDDLPKKEMDIVDDFIVDEADIDSQIDQIKERISDKTAQVNTLESECKNVKQHDLKTLNSLINKWRFGCQTALQELRCEYENRGKNCTMAVLLRTLGIPHQLVHFSEADMDFRG